LSFIKRLAIVVCPLFVCGPLSHNIASIDDKLIRAKVAEFNVLCDCKGHQLYLI